MGKPVAFDASADERDTRGFISMMTMRPSAGFTANCTFEPPVSTPISRNTAIEAVRMRWIFLVGQRERGRDSDGIAGVHAHRVDVLDGADDDGVVALIAHDFHLEFFPAEQRFLDQHLVGGRGFEPALDHLEEFLAVIGDAAAGAAQREARAG